MLATETFDIKEKIKREVYKRWQKNDIGSTVPDTYPKVTMALPQVMASTHTLFNNPTRIINIGESWQILTDNLWGQPFNVLPYSSLKDKIDLIANLGNFFIIRNFKAVQDFLLHNIQLVDLLEELKGRLRLIFGKAIRNVYLEHFNDPEEDQSGIYIEVDTNLSINEKLELLDKFDFEYWLDKDIDIRKNITVSV